jgi:uncharacterized protein YjdB
MRAPLLVIACWSSAALLLAGCSDDSGPGDVPVAVVAIVPDRPHVAVGATVQMTATPLDAEGNPLSGLEITWRTGDPGRATVSSTGLVTGIGVGSTLVEAVVEGVAGSTEVDVELPVAPVASISLAPTTLKVAPSRFAQFTPTLLDAAGNEVTGRAIEWSSADLSVATVDQAGVVVGNAAGSTTVSATIDGKVAMATVEVAPQFEVVSIEVTPPSTSVAERETVQLTLIGRSASGEELPGRRVEWTAGTPNALSVSDRGLVTGIAAAPDGVVVAAADGFIAQVPVVVTPAAVASVTVGPGTLTFGHGGEVSLIAVVRDRGGVELTDRTVAWSVANPSVARIDRTQIWTSAASGYAVVVTGLTDGSTALTATVEGKTGISTLNVTTVDFVSLPGRCGLTSAGQAFCLGSNDYGQLGQGAPIGSFVQHAPVLAQPGLTFVDIADGAEHSCGVTASGAAYCWGANWLGQLGTSQTVGKCSTQHTFTCTPNPQLVSGGLTFTDIDAGTFTTCGITTAGSAYCWGMNNSGQVGAPEEKVCDPDRQFKCNTTPTAVSGGRRYRLLAVGYVHTCGIATDNRTFCWGDNGHGQLGNPGWPTGPAATVVSGGHTFVTIDAGNNHTCALDGTHTVYCWGENEYGQLGRGVTHAGWGTTPEAVEGNLQLEQLGLSGYATCGARSDGTALCWGLGGLGTGVPGMSGNPRPVLGGLTWAAVQPGRGLTTGRIAYQWEDDAPSPIPGQ